MGVEILTTPGAKQKVERDQSRYQWWLTGPGLGLALTIAVTMVALAAWSWTRPDPIAAENSARSAQQAAERAVGPILSYDYRTLEEDRQEAKGLMTDRFWSEKFAPLWATVADNAPASKTVITAAVVDSGVIRATSNVVRVMIMVDRPTANSDAQTPIVYEDHVILTMTRNGKTWLVDDLVTQTD